MKADVYQKIAAGEVVERPLSVVKELVENAVDAGADEIVIELTDGGKRLIRVADNGEGFADDDIETAFRRHTTSKLVELRDLDALFTLGFRGEALASILEVAKIELRTSNKNDGQGTLCYMEGGEILQREGIACQRGTTIEVRDLFYNFPVRRKFLKSDRTELNQIVSFLEPMVLAHHDISFTLNHQNRTVFSYQKAPNLKDRVYQVFGKDFLDGLQPVDFHENNYGCGGFVSRLNAGVSSKKYQFFFVNKRPVREKTLIASLNRTFGHYLEKHQHPAGILLLDIPPADIDVNIHPMKLEIKFRDSSWIYRFVKHAIDSSFGPEARVDMPVDFSRQPDRQPDIPAFGGMTLRARHQHEEVDSTRQQTLFSESSLPSFGDEDGFRLLGQYKDSYIIIEKEGELLVVDQHNAHERANFDRLKKNYQENAVPAISPLFPIIIELSPSEIAALEDGKMEALEKLGFEIQPLSGNAYDIKKFPQILNERNIKEAVLEVIHLKYDEAAFEDSVLATIACKSAIKVNHKLLPEEMKKIVRELYETSNPHFCPHKRPIIVSFSLEEIEKMMKRR